MVVQNLNEAPQKAIVLHTFGGPGMMYFGFEVLSIGAAVKIKEDTRPNQGSYPRPRIKRRAQRRSSNYTWTASSPYIGATFFRFWATLVCIGLWFWATWLSRYFLKISDSALVASLGIPWCKYRTLGAEHPTTKAARGGLCVPMAVNQVHERRDLSLRFAQLDVRLLFGTLVSELAF